MQNSNVSTRPGEGPTQFHEARAWYFITARDEGQHRTVPGIFPNLNAGDATKFLYAPDTTKETRGAESWQVASVRLTWQATSRNKFNFSWNEQIPCNGAAFSGAEGCREQPAEGAVIGSLGVGGLSATTSPELAGVTPGEVWGDRVNEIDIRIGKLLRFGRTRQHRVRRLQFVRLCASSDLQPDLCSRWHVAGSAFRADTSFREDRRADQFLMVDGYKDVEAGPRQEQHMQHMQQTIGAGSRKGPELFRTFLNQPFMRFC